MKTYPNNLSELLKIARSHNNKNSDTLQDIGEIIFDYYVLRHRKGKEAIYCAKCIYDKYLRNKYVLGEVE